jgi:hypothetical protein
MPAPPPLRPATPQTDIAPRDVFRLGPASSEDRGAKGLASSRTSGKAVRHEPFGFLTPSSRPRGSPAPVLPAPGLRVASSPAPRFRRSPENPGPRSPVPGLLDAWSPVPRFSRSPEILDSDFGSPGPGAPDSPGSGPPRFRHPASRNLPERQGSARPGGDVSRAERFRRLPEPLASVSD